MSTPETPETDPDSISAPQPDPALKKRRNLALVKYGLARLGLFVVLTAIIQGLAWLIGAPVPLVISALLALIVSLPLSLLIFQSLRHEATTTLAELDRQRKEYKAWVRKELSER